MGIFNKKSVLWKFINQAEKEAIGDGWILFIKFKRGKVLVVYDINKAERLDELDHLVDLVSDYRDEDDDILDVEIRIWDGYELIYEMFMIKL